jgi:histidine triad (HIT) family protein
MDTCIFCGIVARKGPASIVFEDERCLAFMDIQPVNPGHLLVVPKNHAASLAALKPDTGAGLFRVAQQLAAALRASEIRTEGVNFFLADGEVAGQEVFHVHLHVIPRYAGDGFGFRFGPQYGLKPTRDELNQIASAIKQNL